MNLVLWDVCNTQLRRFPGPPPVQVRSLKALNTYVFCSVMNPHTLKRISPVEEGSFRAFLFQTEQLCWLETAKTDKLQYTLSAIPTAAGGDSTSVVWVPAGGHLEHGTIMF